MEFSGNRRYRTAFGELIHLRPALRMPKNYKHTSKFKEQKFSILGHILFFEKFPCGKKFH